MASKTRSGKAEASRLIFTVPLVMFLAGCAAPEQPQASDPDSAESPTIVVAEGALSPIVITEEVKYDTDDPAIWIHPTDPSQSLIVGTDKNPEDGALYVFDLDGKILPEKTVRPLLRVNNVDIEYG